MRTTELARKAAPRFDVGYKADLDLQLYGRDNLYPNIVRQIISASATGSLCVNRFASFIEGNGLVDENLAYLVVNRHGEMLDGIHRKVCRDLAWYGGFALHIGYNVFGQACEIEHVPFECVRLREPDEWGVVSKVLVHPDWSGRTYRAGKQIKVNRANVQEVDVYNPLRQVVLAQIEAVGGAEYYKGQILYYSMDGELVYPLSRADSVLTEMSTDEGISNIKNRNVRNNFFPAGMLITRRGDRGEGVPNVDGFSDEFVKLQTDTNAVRILEVTIESDEDKPEFVKLETQNYDKAFEVTEESTTQRIYSAYEQEAWYCVRIGKVGFSGSIMADAFSTYNSTVAPYQRVIERVLAGVFKNWFEPTPDNFAIEPLKYISNDGASYTTD